LVFPNNSRLCNTGYLFSPSSFPAFLVRAWRLHSIGRGNMGVWVWLFFFGLRPRFVDLFTAAVYYFSLVWDRNVAWVVWVSR
jgi:hypothetical protein